ncbi:MAG TPA: hypothetical protein VNI20_05155 [Fimbriimonadaceae bacterium]|nr:hypothetical protein [Fimbriimonadaceae bacterium]
MALRIRHAYDGPGLADWLVASACTLLFAANIQTNRMRQMVQSALSYYFDTPWVPQMHLVGNVIDGAIFAFAAVWLMTRFTKFAEVAMIVLAAVGMVLCWVELVYAVHVSTHSIYVLSDLPFQPINNVGVVGAQVFGSYLILKSASGSLKGWRAWLVKGALAVGLWLFQSVVWHVWIAR